MESRVLIVDDDRDTRVLLESLLSSGGHTCETAMDAATALRCIDDRVFDVVVSDVMMEGMSGLELLDRVKQTHPTLPVVLVTGAAAVPQAVDALKRGAFQYVTKPCEANGLLKIVRDALDAHPRRAESLKPSPRAVDRSDLIGSSPAMCTLQTTMNAVAQSSAPVLIIGETGAGKELVARAIHARSRRRQHPFVAVNMSAIPHELMEAEVFGHVRGAFTGAAQARKGLFTEAQGGTLLLDEIGDMSFALQAKLLRVLQSGEVRPVGSERTHHVDVRVIAATHRALSELVKEGRFREDLFFRLNVLPVLVPSLRDHREDIPQLATHFLAEACKRAPHSPVRSISPDALRMLLDASWPGNVRELASVIERAVVFGVDEVISASQLSFVDRAAAPGLTQTWPRSGDTRWTLKRMSRAYTDSVLEETGGNKERAAEILGIDLSTLYRWQRARGD